MKYTSKRFLKLDKPISVYNLETESSLHNYCLKSGDSNIVVKNCELLDVPTIYKPQFEVNLTQALQDIAGVSTAEENLLLHDTSKLEDPKLTPELHVESNLGDHVNIIDYLPEKMFETVNGKSQLKRYPRVNHYIHLDLAVSGGKSEAGISMCHKEFNIDGETGEKQVFYVFDFIMWISAKVRIDINSIEQFIYDLVKQKHIYIDCISCDQFQSDQIRQSFELSGLFRKVLKLSVDVNINPYEFFASQVELGRIKIGTCEYLKRQLCSLKVENGKVQRTTERKDLADSCVGSVELARRNYEDIPRVEYIARVRHKTVHYDELVPDAVLLEI